MSKADLSEALVNAGGGVRRRQPPPPPPETSKKPSAPAQPSHQAGRAGTSPITVHFPMEVRDQLKIMAVEQRRRAAAGDQFAAAVVHRSADHAKKDLGGGKRHHGACGNPLGIDPRRQRRLLIFEPPRPHPPRQVVEDAHVRPPGMSNARIDSNPAECKSKRLSPLPPNQT